MLIFSWNVAGWETSLKHIREKHGSLQEFLKKHSMDIMALQEVKCKPVTVRDTPMALCAEVEGWQSFWSPCTLTDKNMGMNGVAVYARAGTTLRADCEPLKEAELDAEGRCILTEHEKFMLFNVYIPNDGRASVRLPFKMRFLRRLRQVMDEERARTGKPVILVGDLNICRRGEDNHWGGRMVHVDSFLSSKPAEPLLEPLWKGLKENWGEIKAKLSKRTARQIKVTAASQAGRQHTKWKVFGAGPEDGKEVPLAGTFESEAEAQGDNDNYSLDGRTVFCNYNFEDLVARAPGELRVSEIAECAKVLQGVEWTDAQTRLLAAVAGRTKSSPPCLDWIESLLRDGEGMVDAFPEMWPTARGRHTCWDQYKNKRYCNEGARIDFTIVDRRFFEEWVEKGADELYGARKAGETAPVNGNEEAAGTSNEQTEDGKGATPASGVGGEAGPGLGGEQGGAGEESAAADAFDSEESALRACTAHGRWQQAPFDGSGIREGTQADYDTQFFQPHTGIIYTPPQFSDHVAVTLLLKSGAEGSGNAALACDETTRKTQPHMQQRKIGSFFFKTSSNPALAALEGEKSRSPPARAEAANGEGAGGGEGSSRDAEGSDSGRDGGANGGSGSPLPLKLGQASGGAGKRPAVGAGAAARPAKKPAAKGKGKQGAPGKPGESIMKFFSKGGA